MFWEQHVGYKITFPWRYNTESKLNKKHPDIQTLNNILIYNIKWRTSRGTLSWLWANNYSSLTLISKVARFPRNLQVFVVHVVYSKHKRLSKWCLKMFHCCSTLDLVLDLLYGDTTPRHASIHICNRPISHEPSKSWNAKAAHIMWAVVQLINIYLLSLYYYIDSCELQNFPSRYISRHFAVGTTFLTTKWHEI